MSYYYFGQEKEGVYRINSREGVCMDLFVGSESALLWDTGYALGNLYEEVRQVTDRPLIVVNSHGHLDHTCGNCQFDGPIYIHPKDMELCRVHNSRIFRESIVEQSRDSVDYMTGKHQNILPEDFDAKSYIEAGYGNLCPVEEGHRFELGGITLEVLEMPGHTKGSIALHYLEENWLYVSDAMNPFVWLFMEEAEPLSIYRQTLEKAKAVGCKKIATGHDPRILPASVLDDYIKSASQVDFSKGIPFKPDIKAIEIDYEVRICLPEGFSPQDMGKPGCAAVVIDESHLY